MEDIKEEELIEKNSKLKKVIIFVLGLFLVILIVSYLLIGFPLSKIIRGQLESTPLDNNIIELNNFSIIFNEEVLQQLQDIYFNEQEVEFSVCLSGKKGNGDYYIDSLYQPKMFQQTFNHVTFEPCSAETLILLHSHPYKSCLASSTDLDTLEKSKLSNPDVLMVVMCEPARFSVYS